MTSFGLFRGFLGRKKLLEQLLLSAIYRRRFFPHSTSLTLMCIVNFDAQMSCPLLFVGAPRGVWSFVNKNYAEVDRMSDFYSRKSARRNSRRCISPRFERRH